MVSDRKIHRLFWFFFVAIHILSLTLVEHSMYHHMRSALKLKVIISRLILIESAVFELGGVKISIPSLGGMVSKESRIQIQQSKFQVF